MTILLPPPTSTREELLVRLDHHLDRLDGEQDLHHRGQIAAINTALAQMAEGTYGTCLGCGEPINPDRLDREPALSTCLGCVGEDRHLIG